MVMKEKEKSKSYHATIIDIVKWIESTMRSSETRVKGSRGGEWGEQKWPKWPKKLMTQIGWIFVQWPFLDATTHLCKRSCPSVPRLVRPSLGLSVRPSIRSSVRPSVHPDEYNHFEDEKSSNKIKINNTMSDDEEVASDVPLRYLFTSLYEVVSVRRSIRRSVRRSVRRSICQSVRPLFFLSWKVCLLGASCAVYPALFYKKLIWQKPCNKTI